MSIPADAAGVKSPGNLLPACVEQRCLLKSFNPPFTAPLLRICAEIRKGICKKNPKKPFVSGREGDLNHRVLENFSHLFIPGPDISKKKKPNHFPNSERGLERLILAQFYHQPFWKLFPNGKCYLGLGWGVLGCCRAGGGLAPSCVCSVTPVNGGR